MKTETQAKRTQLPWSIELIGDNAAEINPQGYLLRFGGGNDGTYDPDYIADAQFIQRAVNNHESLLAACKAAMRLDYFQEHNALAKQMRDAIAQAESL